jgi:hypothetical protein
MNKVIHIRTVSLFFMHKGETSYPDGYYLTHSVASNEIGITKFESGSGTTLTSKSVNLSADT